MINADMLNQSRRRLHAVEETIREALEHSRYRVAASFTRSRPRQLLDTTGHPGFQAHHTAL
jgi:hypothetical protein